MTKYEKIAEWIIGQNVDHSLKSSDIIEIAENEFNTKLTKAGIGYVKEALLDRGYTNLKDSKFKDSPDWETLKKSKDFVLRRLFKELEEEKAKPMSVMKENNIAEIKSEIRKRAKEIKNVPNDIYDSKFKDEKYIVYLNGEPYYTAKSYDEATEIESKLYSASNTDEDFQGYYGNYPDVEIKKVRDCRFKSKDSDSIAGKKISWDRRALYGVILSENDPLTNKTTIEETSTGKVYFVSTRLLQKAIANGEAKIRDSKVRDGKSEEPDLEFIVEFDNISPINCDTVEEVRNCIKEGKKSGSKVVGIDIYAPNGSTSVKNLRELKEFIEAYKEQMSLEDSKLTHKQKLWYGEELEKFIYPQYLKRNYTLKRIKKGRKTK